MTWDNQPLESATPIASDVSYLLEPYHWWQWVNLVTGWYPLNGFSYHITQGRGIWCRSYEQTQKMRVLLYFRIRSVLACNAMFLLLSYSFRYRIITSYHHITASLTASESAICKEGQWYESRVREKWISADTLSKLSCCLYVYGSLKGQCGSSAATKMFDIYK